MGNAKSKAVRSCWNRVRVFYWFTMQNPSACFFIPQEEGRQIANVLPCCFGAVSER